MKFDIVYGFHALTYASEDRRFLLERKSDRCWLVKENMDHHKQALNYHTICTAANIEAAQDIAIAASQVTEM